MRSRPNTARWTSSRTLQQADRAYVQHVGFEPTPLKIAERRLRGDVKDAPALAPDRDALPAADPASAAVRAALGVIPWDAPPPAGVWPPGVLEALGRVEPPLTAAAARQPEVFLDGLQILRRLRAGEGAATADADALRPLERALWRLLPPATPLPGRPPDSAPALTNAYFQALRDGEKTR